MVLQIRPYRGNDFQFVARSFSGYAQEAARYDPELRPQPAPSFGGAYARSLLRQARKRGGLFLIALAGRGQPTGFIVGVPAPLSVTEQLALRRRARPCMVYELYVSPRFRRRGIGRRLLEELERQFGRRGYDQIRLGVHPKNRSALRLYRSMGFADRAWILGRPIRAQRPTQKERADPNA